MGIRLNKVLSELNIGLETAVDFLKAHQELGEIRDDANPNTKIWDSQYEALVKEFGQVPKLNVMGKIDLDSLNQSRRPKPGIRLNKVLTELNIGLQTAIDFLNNKKGLGEVKDEMTPNTKISYEQYQALVSEFSGKKVIGKIDLSLLNQRTRPKKKSKEERRKERAEKLKQESKPIGKINLDEVGKKKEDMGPIEIITETKPVEQKATIGGNGAPVIGKIDLSLLNQSTRPKKKSKEERRKECAEKLKQESKPIGKINLDEVGKNKEDMEPIEIITETKPVEQKATIGDNRYDIFVSYSRKDSTRVQNIAKELQSKGYKIWIDKEGIESGDAFKAVIVKAIKKAEVFLFFSSIEANKSSWTVKEVNVAVYLKKVIIPVKLDNSEYDDSVLLDLAGLDFIDFTDETRHNYAVSKLDKALKKKIRNVTSQNK